MASTEPNSCNVCMHTFNEADHKAVALPCGHDFCLTCLIRLKTTGSDKCPKCRADWAHLEVQALPGMALSAEAVQREEADLFEDLKKGGNRCMKHEMAYDFWTNKEREFYCKKCVIELGPVHSELQLIDDAVPMIISDIAENIVEANEQLKKDLEVLDDFHAKFCEKFRLVEELKKNIEKLEEKLQECITTVEGLRSKVLSDSALAKKVDSERENIKSEADLPIMVSLRATLEALKQPIRLPALQEPESVLCSIACTYKEGSPFIISSWVGSTTISTKPVLKAAIAAVDPRGDSDWKIDSRNCLAGILALTEKQPEMLTLTAHYDEPEPLPAAVVTAVAKATRDSSVFLMLFLSFFKPQSPTTDQELLEPFLENSSLQLLEFFGHLDVAAIAKLPNTVQQLGLAIGSAADATAVSGLKNWEGLEALHVSVSSDVVASDLIQMPGVRKIKLYFPGLTDARVDSVRPAIEALVRDQKYQCVVLPHCQLTAAGARRLVQQLRGLRIDNITFETSGPWRPGNAERKRFQEELCSVIKCVSFGWSTAWLY